MSATNVIDLPTARALNLAAQGLLHSPRRKPTRTDLLDAIRRMALLQIDTISVVARSPYFVLWTRLGVYPPTWLDQALAGGQLFEYWAHEACLIPIEDYGLLRPRMLAPESQGWKYPQAWVARHRDEIAAVLARIRAEGPLRAADFEHPPRKGDGWWDWKPAKRHLEALFSSGELMIRERRGFQRVYELAERVLPGWDDRRLPPQAHTAQSLVLRSVQALGLARRHWIADYYRMPRAEAAAAFDALVTQDALRPLQVEGWSEPAWITPATADQQADLLAGRVRPTATTLLSPFDPVVWDRRRTRELWDFDYRIECYTPEAKRRYGYFALPILHRGRLVGRLDAKAHRREGVFEVKSLHLEPGVRPTAALGDALTACLERCAAWHGTPALRLPAGRPLPR